ncbi:hypothetical protein RHMOL_Rhmol04G0174200 [Rhododendron molle]|uniref:Uncharacterized protein n=1 Tax=Rhododendron molle TaxID=49168 RepID=A0ACC0P1G4_RHOML|nr:hypothetical protein RHMOL_Rhmol04G0174200 [Rhododendron molle]
MYFWSIIRKFKHLHHSSILFFERERQAAVSLPRRLMVVFQQLAVKSSQPWEEEAKQDPTTPTVGSESFLRRLWYHT